MTKKIREFGIREINEFYDLADKETIIEFAKLERELLPKDGITSNIEECKFVNTYYEKIGYEG